LCSLYESKAWPLFQIVVVFIPVYFDKAQIYFNPVNKMLRFINAGSALPAS
jgi:hypothetical protein